MKNFKELLTVRSEDKFLSVHSRIFNPINVGDFQISIQGSQNHYCEPRATLPIDNYSEMEIAIFEGDKWVQPHTDERFKNFSRLSELLDRYEEGGKAVGGYVSVDLIQDLCNYLEQL